MPALVALAAAAHLRGQCSHSWLPVTPGLNGVVNAMAWWDPDGPGPQPEVVVVGGGFTMAGGIPANGVATYDPVLGTWSALPGMGQFAIVNSMAVLANGTLVASGSGLGATFSDGLVQWTGSSWTPLGGGMSSVSCLLPLPNGDLIIGGNFTSVASVPAMGIARWDGASWSPLAGLAPITIITPALAVRHLALMSNGDIVAGGLFTCSSGQNLARWNGTGWTAMNLLSGTLLDVRGMLGLPNDCLVVGTFFGVHYWNGAAWSELASPNTMPDTRVFAVAPNGDLIAGGYSFVGVARWDGTAWSTLGSQTASGTLAFAWAPNGDLLAGGNYGSTGVLASRIARVTTSCPATVATYGAGCAGAGGLDALSPVTLPWIGSIFRARAVGMPPFALVLSVYGFTTQSIPFASVFPQALPGCTILMNGDLIDVLLPNAGAVDTQIVLPGAPTLVGQTFHHYVVPFEVDLALNITAITNSNALTCTVGAF